MHPAIGTLVVRGPAWKWGGQDGGEGSVGTVVDILNDMSQNSSIIRNILHSIGGLFSSSKTHTESRKVGGVTVIWDNGTKGIYQVGCKGAHDLLVVDSAASGVKHKDVPCHSCKMPEIIGMRWQCLDCSSNFCSTCFYRIKDVHDQHYRAFLRHDTPDSQPVPVNLDDRKKLVEICGIYEGAKVMRGRDWFYGEEDKGLTGEVLKVSNNKVSVRWPSGTNIFTYRRGANGKVDLKVVEAAVGGLYDPQWLPTLGSKSPKKEEETMLTTSTRFAVGDVVKVNLNLEEFRKKQAEFGGWNPLMSKLFSQTGNVCETSAGTVTVQFDGCDRKWYLNPAVLTKISQFSIGQIVRVEDDQETLKALQFKLGNKIAYSLAAEIGRIASKIQVKSEEQFYLELMDLPTIDVPIRPEWLEAVPVSTQLHNMFSRMKSDMVDLLTEAAGEGDFYLVKELVIFHNVPVDAGRKVDGSTALHLACLNGNLSLIQWLLEKKADLEKEDSKGRRALYFAVKGCQPEVLKLLIRKGVELDPLTKRRKLSPLLKAVMKQLTDCALILMDNNCDINIQDEEGDTALHKAAIVRSKIELFEALIHCDRVDLTIKNKKGYNIFHVAVVTANVPVVKLLLERCKEKLPIDDVDLRGRTALMIACRRGHYSLIELLVECGADVNKEDSNSNTPIRFLLKKLKSLHRAPVSTASPDIHNIHRNLYDQDEETMIKYPSLSAVCYLMEKGGRVDLKKETAEPNVLKLIKAFVKDIEMDVELVVDEESYSVCILCSSRATSNLFKCCNTTNSSTCSECFTCFKKCPNCKMPLESFRRCLNLQDFSDDDDDYELDDDIYLNDCPTPQSVIDEPTAAPEVIVSQHSVEHNYQSTSIPSSALTTISQVSELPRTTPSSPDTQPIPVSSPGSQEHRCYPARRATQTLAESNALNVLKEFPLPSAPSPTTAPLASPSAPIGTSAGPPTQQQVQFAANLGLGLASDEQPTNCHSGGRSRKGSYLMQDSLGNTYTKRATGAGNWQCSKKSDGSKNRCTAILFEKEGKFYARGPHRCIKSTNKTTTLNLPSPVESSSSLSSSGDASVVNKS